MALTFALPILPVPSFANSCDTVAKDLGDMAAVDQALRFRLTEEPTDAEPGTHARRIDQLKLIDRSNTTRLEQILRLCGWPKASVHGELAPEHAWLLAQHADHDRKFQVWALGLLTEAVKAGEASGVRLAYLSDRIAVADGRPQLYGTQFRSIGDCGLELQPVDNLDKVEARRKALGMPTMSEYRKMMRHVQPPRCSEGAD